MNVWLGALWRIEHPNFDVEAPLEGLIRQSWPWLRLCVDQRGPNGSICFLALLKPGLKVLCVLEFHLQFLKVLMQRFCQIHLSLSVHSDPSLSLGVHVGGRLSKIIGPSQIASL